MYPIIQPSNQAAHPAATGWDEELLNRAAGVQLPRPGHSESPLGRIHPIRPALLRRRYRLRNRLTGGPESVFKYLIFPNDPLRKGYHWFLKSKGNK